MIQKQKGTKDYYGLTLEKMNLVKTSIESIVRKYNFKEAITPVFEDEDLFRKSAGTESEVVNKEMYTFMDKSDRKLALRPEGTASIVRMVLEDKLISESKEQKFFYFEKMFRYERPQAGRQREFFQFGLEWFNNNSYLADVQVLQIAIEILDKLKVQDYTLELNTIGSLESRNKYLGDLKMFFEKNVDKLSPISIKRLETNPLRILDSKEPEDILILKDCPIILDYITPEEKANFEMITSTLDKLNISYKVNPFLVRGLDYYGNLVFEFMKKTSDSNLTILGGGRYNELVSKFGGDFTPAIGFAIGIERLIMASSLLDRMEESIILDYLVLPTSIEYNAFSLEVAAKLRADGKVVEILGTTQSLSKKLNKANSLGVGKVIIIGEASLNNEYTEKNLLTSEEITLKLK